MDNKQARPSGSQAMTSDILAMVGRPSGAYAAPADVLRDDDLTLYEKRAILASWASDLWTVDSEPGLRAPLALRSPARIDDIMRCLRALDIEMERRCVWGGGSAS